MPPSGIPNACKQVILILMSCGSLTVRVSIGIRGVIGVRNFVKCPEYPAHSEYIGKFRSSLMCIAKLNN